MTPSDRILALLSGHGADFRILDHPEARSAPEAAAARGTPLRIGGKSLVMKLDRGIGFALLVVGGDRQVDNRLLRAHLRVRRYRFATTEELLRHTGLTPGCVPPFGRPVFDLPLYVDEQRACLPRIAFSLGSHTRSVIMDTADWLAIARPAEVFSLSRPGS
ncbi:MAG TPA: hypothetical protein ENK18_22775 [Deltaproteobacteria bacterium]|nr:hypothetical protein [Deltaproteobacteria bacterium]